MKQYYLKDDSPQILYRRHRTLSLDISTEKGEFQFNCEFITPSYSTFQKAASFYHPDPPFSRLFVIEEGRAKITMDGRSHILQKGDIALLPAGHPFYADYRKGLVCKAVHLHLHDGLGFVLGQELCGMRKIRKPELFAALLSAIHTEPECVAHSLMVSAVLLLIEPVFPAAAERLTVPPFYRELISRLDSRPPARLRLEEIARDSGLSRSALGKGFRRHFGLSFKAYQKNLLLTKARKLLLNTELSISQIADELGFNQVFYFFEFFRRGSGITPLEFRRQNSGSNVAEPFPEKRSSLTISSN